MTDVEHYALSLAYFALIGFIVGVAGETLEEYKRGRRTSLDLLYIWGLFFAIGYGVVGFKFIDGRYFIWIIPLLLAGVSSRFGRHISSSRKDLSLGVPILTAYFAVPLLFHFVL